MFTKTKNIDTAFRQVRLFAIIIVMGCFAICAFTLFKSYELAAKVQDRIYVLAGDKAIDAMAANRRDNIPVEAKDHIKTFHQYFFTLDPDDQVINANITKALYLADGSAKKQYDNLKETGYYANIISGNISQEVSIDSILLDTKALPYFFKCYGELKIIRPNSIVTRSLVTQGYLRNLSRSDHNPHGFLIERWETLENKDLKTENR